MSGNEPCGALWRKSSYSNGQANCVEVAIFGRWGAIAVRDSKTPDGPGLMFTSQAWRQFADTVRADAENS